MVITVFRYILYFFFYSAAGWLFESTYCSIGERKLINRGFLTGPMCPIYGTGATVMAVLLYNPFRDKPMLVFLLGMVLCDIVEYLTSFFMEKLFNARWWNYEGELLNINGRICLKHTLYWGVASILFVKVVHPRILTIFAGIPDKYIIIITTAVLAVFVIDVAFAAVKAVGINKLRHQLAELKRITKENTGGAVQFFGDAYNSVKLAAEGKYDSLITALTDKKDAIQDSIDRGNDKINYARDEIIFNAQAAIHEFEQKVKHYARFDKPVKIKNSFFNAYRKKNRGRLSGIGTLYKDIKSMIEEFKAYVSDKNRRK